MAWCDFVIKFDPEKDTSEDLTERILFSIVVNKLRSKKPIVWFVGGGSGEGKTLTTVKLQQILCKIQGINFKEYRQFMNVFSPLQYTEKLDLLLHDKSLKKVNMLTIHEAREMIRAKLWYSFMAQSVSDVNAMSRAIKPICFMIISQFIRDITSDIRYTLNYYSVIKRPSGKKARLYINVMYKDDRDVEKPKLKKRRLSGYIVKPNGKYQRFSPDYIEITKPDKETIDWVDAQDKEAKTTVIRDKLTKLMDEIKSDLGQQTNKIPAMIQHYTKNIDSISMIGRRNKNGWKLTSEFRDMHDLTPTEAKVFEKGLNDKIKEMGLIDGEKE